MHKLPTRDRRLGVLLLHYIRLSETLKNVYVELLTLCELTCQTILTKKIYP
jgi:hypothetical protein